MAAGITRIGVLASGGGSNMQAIQDGIDAATIHGRIVLVASDKPEAYALERARQWGIPVVSLPYQDYPTREDFSTALAARFLAADIDLVVYAGFMRIVTKEFSDHFRERSMNIHPALIPSFCGPGFYGHRVHEAVLAYGAKVSGCTVHFVEEVVDGGPIILQRCVAVREDDTAETLAARVLLEEHRAYPEAVRLFCAGRLRIDGRLVRVLPG